MKIEDHLNFTFSLLQFLQYLAQPAPLTAFAKIGLPPVAELIPEAKTCLINMVRKCLMIVERLL